MSASTGSSRRKPHRRGEPLNGRHAIDRREHGSDRRFRHRARDDHDLICDEAQLNWPSRSWLAREWVRDEAVTVTSIRHQPAEGCELGHTSVPVVRHFELRWQAGVPVDARLGPVRIEVTEYIPSDNHIRQAYVHVRLVAGTGDGTEGRLKRVPATSSCPVRAFSTSGTRAFRPDPRSRSTCAPAVGAASSNSSISRRATDAGGAKRKNWRPSGAWSVGREISARVDEHVIAVITGAPTLAGGRLYVATSSGEEVIGANPRYECCKFRGSVSALDASTGKVLWKSYTIPEEPKPVRKNKQGTQLWGPSGAGVWSAPTVDLERRAVYVTTGDSYSDPAASTSDAFVAFDARSTDPARSSSAACCL